MREVCSFFSDVKNAKDLFVRYDEIKNYFSPSRKNVSSVFKISTVSSPVLLDDGSFSFGTYFISGRDKINSRMCFFELSSQQCVSYAHECLYRAKTAKQRFKAGHSEFERSLLDLYEMEIKKTILDLYWSEVLTTMTCLFIAIDSLLRSFDISDATVFFSLFTLDYFFSNSDRIMQKQYILENMFVFRSLESSESVPVFC